MISPDNTEIWRTIPEFDSYEVSDHGRVRRAKPGRGTTVGRILKPSRDKYGHLKVCLYLGRAKHLRTRGVHQLVLAAFVGTCPAGMESCHFDGDAANNQLANLRYDSSKSNNADTMRHKREGKKLDAHMAAEIRRRYVVGDVRQRDLAEEFGVTKATICRIASRKIWHHPPQLALLDQPWDGAADAERASDSGVVANDPRSAWDQLPSDSNPVEGD